MAVEMPNVLAIMAADVAGSARITVGSWAVGRPMSIESQTRPVNRRVDSFEQQHLATFDEFPPSQASPGFNPDRCSRRC